MDITVKAGEAFTLPDGSVVYPNAEPDGTKVAINMGHEDEQEDDDEDIEFIEAPVLERTLADVPTDYKTMTTTMIVVAYAAWGLNTFATSKLLNTTEDHIQAIRDSDLFDQLFKELKDGVRFSEAASVHGYLMANAKKAAKKVVRHISSKDGDRSLSASRDVLDRAGFRPVDRVDHHHTFDDELVIRYVEDTKLKTIDLDVGE